MVVLGVPGEIIAIAGMTVVVLGLATLYLRKLLEVCWP
jgi:hypothetical protein